MKKLAFGLLFVAGIAGASCVGPYCWDESGSSINSRVSVPSSGIMLSTTETITVGVSTPTAAGLLGIDSSYVLYISSGTGRGAWIKIGGQ